MAEKSYNIRRLEELILKKPAGEVEYVDGTRGYFLFGTEKIVVQRMETPAGVELPCHQHDVLEVVVVYEGDLEIAFLNGISIFLTKGGVMQVPPRAPHGTKTRTGCLAVSMLIPSAEGFAFAADKVLIPEVKDAIQRKP